MSSTTPNTAAPRTSSPYPAEAGDAKWRAGHRTRSAWGRREQYRRTASEPTGCCGSSGMVSRRQLRRSAAAGVEAPPGSVLESETHLQGHLERVDFTVHDVTADLGRLEPLDIANGSGHAGDAVPDGLLYGLR